MKEKIEGVVVYPCKDTYVIRIYRHMNGTNLTKYRDYTNRYYNIQKAKSRVSRFLYMVNIVQNRLVDERISNARTD